MITRLRHRYPAALRPLRHVALIPIISAPVPNVMDRDMLLEASLTIGSCIGVQAYRRRRADRE